MDLLSDEAQVELCSVGLEIVLILTQDRCTVCTKHTIGYHRLINSFGRTRWNLQVTWVVWNIVLVRLEIVLLFMQDWCTVCVERTIGLKIVLEAPDGTPR
jgi:hypothetical protein